MSSRGSKSLQEVNEMRDIGRSMSDRGFIEVNFSTGTISWVNEHMLKKLGYTLQQITSMSVFDVVPEEHHDISRGSIYDLQKNRAYRFSIRPILTADQKVSWWYSLKVSATSTTAWFKSELLMITEKSGPEYISMVASMQTTIGYNDLYNRLHELQNWSEDAVKRLDAKDKELEDKIVELSRDVRSTKKAAETAANVGLEVQSAMKNLETNIANEMSSQTTEILNLITTDSLHSARLDAFENHVKATTQTAMTAITNKANEAGSGLTKKVTIPISAIAAIATIIQYLIQHFGHRLSSLGRGDGLVVVVLTFRRSCSLLLPR